MERGVFVRLVKQKEDFLQVILKRIIYKKFQWTFLKISWTFVDSALWSGATELYWSQSCWWLWCIYRGKMNNKPTVCVSFPSLMMSCAKEQLENQMRLKLSSDVDENKINQSRVFFLPSVGIHWLCFNTWFYMIFYFVLYNICLS